MTELYWEGLRAGVTWTILGDVIIVIALLIGFSIGRASQ